MPDDQPRGFSALIAPFFAEGAKVEGGNEGGDIRVRVTLPDGRHLTLGISRMDYGNPNAKPPVDFRDGLAKDDGA